MQIPDGIEIEWKRKGEGEKLQRKNIIELHFTSRIQGGKQIENTHPLIEPYRF